MNNKFNPYTGKTEVTMCTSSWQKKMEGELVCRHAFDAVFIYNKHVYGIFLAIRIDAKVAETFRHDIWYAKGDVKQRLDIVTFPLEQFSRHFVSMVEGNRFVQNI